MERTFSRSTSDSSPVESWRQKVDFASLDVSGLEDGDLPAYSPTIEPGTLPADPGVCCAFQVLNECIRDAPGRENVMLQHPRHQFLCWVALCRTTDPNIPIETRRKCPFQWCEYAAASTDGVELLNHVSGCSRFAEGQYICPYCRKPESFMRAQRRSRLLKPTRRHFLKCAFTALYRLGSKSLQKAIHPAKLNGIHHDRRQSKKRRYDDELDTISAQIGDEKQVVIGAEIELDGTEVQNSISAPQADPSAAELPSRRTRIFEMEGILPVVVEPPKAELASKRFSAASSESALVTSVSASSASSPVSPVTSEQWICADNFNDPISPTGLSDFFSWTNEETHHEEFPADDSIKATESLSHDLPVPSGSAQQQSLLPSLGARTTAKSFPNIRIDTTCANDRPVGSFQPRSTSNCLGRTPSPLQIESQTQSPVRFVEELRGLFNTTFKLSHAKLIQPPPYSSVASVFGSYPSAAQMFEKAWQAIAKVLHDDLPSTFSEVFAIAHLGYSCALATQEIDLDQQLWPIFSDLTEWSLAIQASEEQTRYLNLIQKLFSPQASSGDFSALEEPLDGESNLLTPTPLNRAASARSRGFPLWPSNGLDFEETNQLSARDSNVEDRRKLCASLKNGVIVRLCVQYLSTFEYLCTDSSDDDFYQSFIDLDDSPPVTEKAARYVCVLRQEIIDQLMVIRGIESFRPVIENAAMLLSTVPRTKLRDLELYLVHEGRTFARNQSMYRKFVDVITQLCDRASIRLPCERSDRARYLRKDINQVLAFHRQLQLNEHAEAYRQIQGTPAYRTYGVTSTNSSTPAFAQDQPSSSTSQRAFSWVETPTSSSASPSNNTVDALGLDLSSDALFGNELDVEFGGMPLQQPAQSTISAVSTQMAQGSPPSEVGEGSMACHICGRVLQGKLIYLPSNMRRHVRELHMPDAKKLVCTIDGCGKAFVRNHNLVQHQRSVHHVQSRGLEDGVLLN